MPSLFRSTPFRKYGLSIAPYDVRQSGFTGAGVNAVTRSGDNTFRGSAYLFTRSQKFIGPKVDTFTPTNQAFTQNQYGFRIGGPIIKDKRFFFLNAEVEDRTDPGSTYTAFRPGDDAANPAISNVRYGMMDSLRTFLKTQYGYDAGAFENYNFATANNKILAKIDWNANKNHKFTIRYSRLQSQRNIPISNSGAAGFNRQPGKNTLPFQNASYIQNNNMNSVVAEFNSVFGTRISNNFIAGFTSMRDYRESPGGVFPLVDILSGGNTIASFGYEPSNCLKTP